MTDHDGLLAAFLAGDLDPGAARECDEHLLDCERCWRAVREDRAGRQAAALLRQPPPAELADRVAFAVELAGAAATAPRLRWIAAAAAVTAGRAVRPRLRWIAAATAVTAGLAVTVALVAPGGRAPLPAPVAAVARYAEAVPRSAHYPGPGTGGQAAPVEVGHPVTVTAGGHPMVVRTWRLGGTEVVVATSGRPFPMPPGAQGTSGGGMAWVARAGKLSLYCINGRTSELVAAPVPAAELATLAARLPPA